MLKRLIIFFASSAFLVGSLGAKSVTLRGSNGKEVAFQLQVVSAEGLTVTPQGSYRSMLIKWEQLDQEWLQQNQPEIWSEKERLENQAMLAYGAFQFGQTRDAVVRQIKQMKAMAIPGDYFSEMNQDVLWICTDPESLRRFIGFSFNAANQLDTIEMHMNFSSDEDLTRRMQLEWERVIKMVESFNSNPLQRDRFPLESKWRQEARVAEKDGRYSQVTHRWSDDRRQIELRLEAKEVNISFGEIKMGKMTAFGAEVDTSSVVSTASNKNWVVYKARMK
jgi:hypothetical protein